MERPYDYKPGAFFAAAYVATWIPWFIGACVGAQAGWEPYASLFSLVGLLGPAAVALFLIVTSGSAALKSDFKDRLVNLARIRPAYLLIAIVMPPLVIGLSIFLSLWFGEPRDQFRISADPNLAAMIILALILAPIIEEVGWRGYGVDSLRAEAGMLKATLLFAVLWTAWHAPLVLIPGTYQNQVLRMDNLLYVANFFVSIIPVAIIANWLYYKNNRSIPAAIVLHAMLNAAAVLINAGQVAKCIATLLYAGIAAAVIALDRALFAEGPRNFLSGLQPTRRSAD